MEDKNEKPYEGQCSSYVKNDEGPVRCGNRGRRRIDRGLDSGIHCDSCWGRIVEDCRSKSW